MITIYLLNNVVVRNASKVIKIHIDEHNNLYIYGRETQEVFSAGTWIRVTAPESKHYFGVVLSLNDEI